MSSVPELRGGTTEPTDKGLGESRMGLVARCGDHLRHRPVRVEEVYGRPLQSQSLEVAHRRLADHLAKEMGEAGDREPSHRSHPGDGPGRVEAVLDDQDGLHQERRRERRKWEAQGRHRGKSAIYPAARASVDLDTPADVPVFVDVPRDNDGDVNGNRFVSGSHLLTRRWEVS